MTARRVGSTSPFYDAGFAVTPNRARRNRAKLAAVEALAQRWLGAEHPDGSAAPIYQEFGRELLDTIHNAGEPT